jgi:hypothetical protein
MVFAILCETAVRLETGRRSRNFDYVVYGDDIVIRSRFAARLVELLGEFDFIVNSDKSFYGDDDLQNHFREACGIEAYNGEDITPLRLSRRLVSPTMNDSEHQAGLGVGLLDLLNRSYLYGYLTLHRWINDVLKEYHWFGRVLRVSETNYRRFADSIQQNLTPWVRVTAPFVITADGHDTQWRSFSRRHIPVSPIQQTECRVIVAKTRPRPNHGDDNDLFSWFVEQEQLPSTDEFIVDATGIVTLRPRDLKWSKTWAPLMWGAPPAVRLRPTN